MMFLCTWHLLYSEMRLDCIIMTIGGSTSTLKGWWEGQCFYKNNSQAANIAFAMQALGHQGRVEQGLMPKPVLVKPL